MTIRSVILGCGKVADDHAEAIRFNERAELVACCDLEPLMAEQLATRYSIPDHFSDISQMLTTVKPDVVHITTPPQSHLSIAQMAFEHGCHVWVEKPFAMNHSQTAALLDGARTADRLVTIGHSYWLDTPALDVRQLIGQGAVGDIVHVESWYGYDLSGAYGKAIMGSPDNWVHQLPGKIFQNNVDHLLNKVLEFIKSPADDIELTAQAFRRLDRSDGDVRDDLLDELRTYMRDPVSGVTSYATFTSSVRPAAQWMRVYGTHGTIEADFNLRTVEMATGVSLPTNLGRLLPGLQRIGKIAKSTSTNLGRFAQSEFHYFAGFRTLLREFYEAIETGGEPPISYEEIERMTKLQDRIWEQVYPS